MPENSANKPAPAQDTRFRHNSSACQKRRGFATLAGLGAIIVFLAVVLVGAYALHEPICTFAVSIGYKNTDEMSAAARLIRDVILFCAGAFGIFLAKRRSDALDEQAKAANEQAETANKQAKTANDQAETANKQAATAAKRLLNEQFSNAVELMAKETSGDNPKPAIAARIGGIYIMADLAIKQAAEFANQVVINLIAYIKHNAQITATPELQKDETPAKPRTLGDDVKAAFSALSDILGNEKINIDERILDFSQVKFSGLDFSGIDLQHYKKWVKTKFIGCYLADARFADGADMQRADFSGANLHGAILGGVDMGFAIMKEANLTYALMQRSHLFAADFRGAILNGALMQDAVLTCAKMHGCYMRRAELQKANMERAELTGAYLESAKLDGADMTRVNVQNAVLASGLYDVDLSGAKFGKTYMRVAIGINQLPEHVKEAMNKQIWHSGSSWSEGIENHPDNTDWQLAQHKDGYALAGVLKNFAGAPFSDNPDAVINKWSLRPHLPGEPENIQRQAAELDLDKLPDNTPEEIKAWLREIKAKCPKK